MKRINSVSLKNTKIKKELSAKKTNNLDSKTLKDLEVIKKN
jgi:hypothetical protein